MAFNDIDIKRIENAMAIFLARHRPLPHIRSKLDIGYRLTGQSIEIFEIRPQWDNPSIIHEYPFSKASYVRSQNLWKVFWKRADLKWHRYDPVSTVRSIDEFLAAVEDDPYGCFFG